jgi:predicted RNase H-like HicB family nuclease
MKYRITLIEDEDGGWAVRCDDLPGCFSQGETREEAIENIRIAIREFTQYLRDEGLPAEYAQGHVQHEEISA